MKRIEESMDTLKKYYDNWHLEPDHFGLQVVEKATQELLTNIQKRLSTEEFMNRRHTEY